MSMKLQVIIHKAEEGGYWAEVPALPGCVTQGDTPEEVEVNVQEAIELWLEVGESSKIANSDDRVLEMVV